MRSLSFIGVTGMVLFTLAGSAWGMSKCAVGCRAQLRMRFETALVASTVCRLDCRDSDPSTARDCSSGCRGALRDARQTYRIDANGCRDSCAPASDLDESCLEGCATQLQSCAGPVRMTAVSCARACKTAPDRLSCLQACLATAQADDTACGDAFDTCLTDCAPPAP
jgi:hypothetical protein